MAEVQKIQVVIPDKNVAWYIKDEDLLPVKADVREFLARYCGIPEGKVDAHVLRVVRPPSVATTH